MVKSRTGQLVCQHLENISSGALEEYQKIIKDYIKRRHGVYGLYKNSKLYYSGLASDLRWRLKHHLRDKHAGKWDRFSIYLIIDNRHLKELETLIIHMAKPQGNTHNGNFINSENLEKKFRKDINVYQKNQISQIFLDKNIKTTENNSIREKYIPKTGRKPTLAKYVKKRTLIRWIYKGHLYIAYVRKDGTISFAGNSYDVKRLKGKIYTSPSTAALAVANNPTDSWKAWKYERSPGEWILLNEMRK